MVRRTALNVVEKLVSPLSISPLMVGITHPPFLESLPVALAELGTQRALVYQAVEGSDEVPLDGNSSLVLVRNGEVEESSVSHRSLLVSVGPRSPTSRGKAVKTRPRGCYVPWKARRGHCGISSSITQPLGSGSTTKR